MTARQLREAIGDWLMLLGGLALAASLFLTWSHQLSGAFGAAWSHVAVVRTVPRDPTAWQVYSLADVLLLAVAAAIVYVAFAGRPRARLLVSLAVAVALAFVLHARAVAPTNGVAVAAPPPGASQVIPDHARPGAGETVAMAALIAAAAGLLVSFTAD